MGKRGPPKTPNPLKIIRGTQVGCVAEIKPEKPEELEAPDWLSEESKVIWCQLSKKLEALGLLTNIDLNGFGRYCDLIPKWLKAKKTLDEKGFYYPIMHKQTPAEIAAKVPPRVKYLQQFPEVSIYMQLGKELSRLEQLYGLNPSSRASLNVQPAGGKGELEKRLFGN